MIQKIISYVIFAIITLSTQLNASETKTPVSVMNITEYKRECSYPFVFQYYLDNVDLPREVVRNIFILINPRLNDIRTRCFEDLRLYIYRDLKLGYDEKLKNHYLAFVKNLLQSCSTDVSSMILKNCLYEKRISFDELYKPLSCTAFHAACFYNDLKCVKVLLNSIDENTNKLQFLEDSQSMLGILLSVNSRNFEIVEHLILAAGDDALKLISTPHRVYEVTAIHYAVLLENTEMLDLFITITGKNSWKAFTFVVGSKGSAFNLICEKITESNYQRFGDGDDHTAYFKYLYNFLLSSDSGRVCTQIDQHPEKPKKKPKKDNCLIQ